MPNGLLPRTGDIDSLQWQRDFDELLGVVGDGTGQSGRDSQVQERYMGKFCGTFMV